MPRRSERADASVHRSAEVDRVAEECGLVGGAGRVHGRHGRPAGRGGPLGGDRRPRRVARRAPRHEDGRRLADGAHDQPRRRGRADDAAGDVRFAVFSTSTAARSRGSTSRREVWHPALELAGLEKRPPYSLRHTFAYWTPPRRRADRDACPRRWATRNLKRTFEVYGGWVREMGADAAALRESWARWHQYGTRGGGTRLVEPECESRSRLSVADWDPSSIALLAEEPVAHIRSYRCLRQSGWSRSGTASAWVPHPHRNRCSACPLR